MQLEGKRGIGLATAHASIAKGAQVFITGRRTEVLESALHQLRTGGGNANGIAADVSTDEGRTRTLNAAVEILGGVDILINNAGGVRAGRLETTSEDEIRAMVDVDLLAPILLARAALPHLRASEHGVVVNITSGIALMGVPFYTTYAAVKAGLARFGEALRRELKGEGVHVLTVYPGGTDTPMMKSNRAGPELGFGREPASAVADAIMIGIETGAFEVTRGGETREKMIALNRDDPAAIDQRFLELKLALAEAVKDHSAL